MIEGNKVTFTFTPDKVGLLSFNIDSTDPYYAIQGGDSLSVIEPLTITFYSDYNYIYIMNKVPSAATALFFTVGPSYSTFVKSNYYGVRTLLIVDNSVINGNISPAGPVCKANISAFGSNTNFTVQCLGKPIGSATEMVIAQNTISRSVGAM